MSKRLHHTQHIHQPNWIWMSDKDKHMTHRNFTTEYLKKSSTFFIQWPELYFVESLDTKPALTDFCTVDMPVTYDDVAAKFKGQGCDIDSLYISEMEKAIKDELKSTGITGPVFIKEGTLDEQNRLHLLIVHTGGK